MQQAVVALGRRVSEDDFDVLVGPHLEAGYRVALTILRNPDEAHDAVQEAAINAWRRIRQLRDANAAKPWFLAIVANQCRSIRRGHWWSVLRMPTLERASTDFPVDHIDIRRAIAKLPDSDRLALFLHFYLDLQFDEIGTVLGVSAAGAKTRVYRAAKELRPDLEMTA